MSHFQKATVFTCVAVISAALITGCASNRGEVAQSHPSPRANSAPAGRISESSRSNAVSTASHSETTDSAASSADLPSEAEPRSENARTEVIPLNNSDDPFTGEAELPLPQLVHEVLARNASLQAALAAWQAAAQRYPQEIAFDDPVLQSMSAPGSFRSSSPVQSSYYVGFAQKVPWAGKRELRGDKAQAEANALSLDYQDSRLRLAEAARLAFYDFFLVYRNRELNDANRRILEEFRDTARKRYESNLVTRQDVLQAEVELAKLDRRRLELERTERVTRARINTLLHRQPNYPLPPPPRELLVGGEVLDVDVLQHLAIEQRPDLAAQASRLQAEQTSVALACKEFYPDFEFMGRYDAFWTDRVQRGQVGMNMNIPLNQNRRCAAVNEALFRVSKMQAEYNQQVDNIHNDVEASFARVDESRKVVQLYREKILPAAEDNVRAAASEYTAGKVDFLRLIAAQQELIALQENSYEAVTDFFRRRAELERVLASPLPEADSPTEVRPPIGE